MKNDSVSIEPVKKRFYLVTLITCGLVAVSYAFWDRPFADFIHAQQLRKYPIIDDLLVVKTASLWAAFVGTLFFGLKQLLGTAPLASLSRKLWVISVTLLLASVLKDFAKDVFGRYWPETWVNNNPSWIHNHAYGFHPFHSGQWYESFPSGHTTVMVCLGTCLWLLFPRLKVLAVALPLMVVTCLLLLDYHFISDVIAGTYLGVMIAVTSVHIHGLRNA